jgi:hypothetical protein
MSSYNNHNYIIVKHINNASGTFTFYYYNNSGSYYWVGGFDESNLFKFKTGDPYLTSAILERDDGTIEDVMGGSAYVNSFQILANHYAYLTLTFENGLFSFGRDGDTSVQNNTGMSMAASCNISGNCDIPDYFMGNLFRDCIVYNPGYMYGSTFNLNGLRPTRIGEGFLYYTFRYGISIHSGIAPETIGWNVKTIGNNFLNNTWTSAFSTSNSNVLTLKGNIYTGTIKGLTTNAAGISNSKISEIMVDSNLISTYQSNSYWSSITDSKFVSW